MIKVPFNIKVLLDSYLAIILTCSGSGLSVMVKSRLMSRLLVSKSSSQWGRKSLQKIWYAGDSRIQSISSVRLMLIVGYSYRALLYIAMYKVNYGGRSP
ncbi:hypothetical protein BDR22DRAFT_305045 [Usnea florida]